MITALHFLSLLHRRWRLRHWADVLTMIMLRTLVLALIINFFTSATVVLDFNHVERCKDSLYMGTPPRGFIDTKLKKICQRYADKPRYVTLYDPQKRIPVYSAYTFKKTEGDRRVDYPWMYEPQVRVFHWLLHSFILEFFLNKLTLKLSWKKPRYMTCLHHPEGLVDDIDIFLYCCTVGV